MTDCYRTLRQKAHAKIVRKKSRFISTCHHVESSEEVASTLERARLEYHDATHRCYAYRILADDNTIEYSSDAGEPSGSAGLPILQQIQKQDLYNVLVIVARYFGGTKLGIRGLIQAYGDAATEVLSSTKAFLARKEARLSVRFPPEISSQVFALIHRHPAQVENVNYDEQGHVLVVVPRSVVRSFTGELTEVTGARAHWEEEND
jgi:uncharacterized YigZ family protein